ncbi:MAG: hypothetical protein FJ143_01275, partial [Deltaproteobacteria bacterium]|nr:hypothetical protein [Deltaproteobacteria bacterium]
MLAPFGNPLCPPQKAGFTQNQSDHDLTAPRRAVDVVTSSKLEASSRHFGAPRMKSNLVIARAIGALVLSASIIQLPSAQAQELRKVRMGYPAFSLTFLTFFVAKDTGIYKKHGLDVDLVQLAGAVQTSALVAGEIDYLTGITGPLVAAARGLPFKGI